MARIKRLIKKVLAKYKLARIKVGLMFNRCCNLTRDDTVLNSVYGKKNVTCYVRDRKFTNKIDLSIIIPSYNGEKYVRKCIESVLNNKTNYSYEIILVNDGSKDDTLKIMKQYEKEYPEKIKVLDKKNGGISSARNLGMDYADGRYISFLDCDDFLGENYIERLLGVAYEKNVEIVKCGTGNVAFESGRIVSNEVKPYEEIHGLMNEKILNYSSYAWGCIYKSELLKNVQFPLNYIFEDMICRFLMFRKTNGFINLDEVHHYRGIHENQMTSKLNKNVDLRVLDHLYLLELLVNENDKFGLPDDAYLYLNVLLECSSIMASRIDKLDDEIKKQVFIRAYELVRKFYKKEYEPYLKGKYELASKIMLNKRYDLWLLLKNC